MSSKKNNKQHKPKGNTESISPEPKAVPAVELGKNKKENEILYYIGLGIVLLLIYMIRKNYLNIPFERDEGSYAYSGKIILDGAIPFIDIGSQRLDGVFYAYSVLVWLFGYSVKNLHMAFLVMNMASATMLFFLTRKLSNNMGGLAAAAFFALLSMIPSVSGFTIQSEHIVAFLIIAAFLALFHFFETNKILLLIVSGILFSFAFQVKQTSFFYGIIGGALLLFKGFFEDKSSIKTNIVNAVLFGTAVVVPILFDLLMIYKNGAWNDFNLWFFDIRKQYTSLISFDQGLEYLKGNMIGIYRDYKPFWIFSFIATIGIFFTSISLWKKIAVATLNIAGFLTVVPGYHYYGHYFLQWIPAVSIAAAMFVFSIQDLMIRFKLNSVIAIVVPLVLIIIPVYLNLKELNRYYFKPNLTQVLRAVYGFNPFPESKVIADKLNSVMKEEDKIAVFGTEIQMYVYTNKKSPSRFAGSGALLEFPVKQSNDWQREFIADVEKAKPRFLIFFNHPISWMANPKTENLIFPWFDKFTAANYKIYGFADMLEGSTNYVWEPNIDMVNNPPKAQYRIYIFERK
jgi:Dolichyl-phosphate-mannose-protein mannosyltransferase